MLRKALCSFLLLAVAGIACDDADPPRPRDAAADARRDGGTDARDSGSDRAPDSATPDAGVDSPVDSPSDSAPPVDTRPPDGMVDRAIDSPPADAPVDTLPPDTAPPDTAPPDTAPPDTQDPDTAPPDTQEPDASPDTGGGVDAQPVQNLNNGCAAEVNFMDLTAMDNVEIDWVITNALPICLKVKAGTDVVWQVTTGQTFATHPVEQFPVDPTSPIDELYNEANDDDYTVPFPNPGTFGFRCNIHQGVMRGSIWVVP